MLQTVRKLAESFFNLGAVSPDQIDVDVRDMPMVARFTNTDNPFDGWGYFIIDAVNAEQRKPDAFKVTEEGYTYFEARLYGAIQENFRKRSNLIVTIEKVAELEREADQHPDYYTQLAIACQKFEQSNQA